MLNFHELLSSEKPLLIVSLPENSLDYARAAIDNGADAIKLHVNLKHRVTGQIHTSWKAIKSEVEKIKELNCCMGIVPGTETMASPSEIKEMEDSGFSFFDVYIDYAPLYLLNSNMAKMLALNYTYELYMVKHLVLIGADAVEISIINPSDYGKPLTLLDITKYKEILSMTKLPAFVPTQKKISSTECERLLEMGFRGIIIGPIVTGVNLRDFSKAVREYGKVIHG